jgi:prepilin-type N-terminal cleavage/methylation domain-containing protein
VLIRYNYKSKMLIKDTLKKFKVIRKTAVKDTAVKKQQVLGQDYTCGKKGFSLPELIIVIAIFAIITTIAMFDQARLNSSTLLTNMAYEIALSVREAQVYGIGVRDSSFSTTATGIFSGQYGAHFNIATPREVMVFGNASETYVPYNPSGPGTQARVRYVFENQRGNFISAICVGNLESGAPRACQTGQPEISNVAEVVFRRPVPAPNIYKGSAVGTMTPTPAGERVYVVVHTLDRANCRVVVVEPTGQIRVVDSSSGLCVKS